MKKLPKGEKQFLKKKIIYFIFSLCSDHKKRKLFPFSTNLIPEIRKSHGKTSIKFFFFFLIFCTLPLLVMEKKIPLTFFPKFREKVLKNPPKCAQVSLFTNYVFSAVFTRTHTHLPTHTLYFSDP